MGGRVLRKLTLQNLKAHRKTEMAFVLASSVFMSLVYIVFSLIKNRYVQTRHDVLPTIMTFAAFLILAFSLIFIIYASNFIMKQRHKELGLYSILGLEKKHIRAIVGVEIFLKYLAIAGISLPGGYLFGSLSFMLINKLMQDTSTGFFEYPFDPSAALITLLVLFFILLLVFIINSLKITISNPLALMKSVAKGEKEPKSNMLVLILGLVCMIWGYRIAFTTEGVLDSIFSIFQAIILVIVGTYFLFNALTIFVLKLLKKNKAYYYKAENFLSISGMLYRMKANANSLASIAVLSTGIMLVLGMTFTSYLSMEDIVNSSMEADYEISYSGDPTVLDRVVDEMRAHVDVIQVTPYAYTFIAFDLSDGQMKALISDEFTGLGDLQVAKNAGMATVMTLEDYNKAYGKNLSLKDQEVGLSSNTARWNQFDQIRFMDQDYGVIQLETLPSSRIAIDYLFIVIPDTLTYQDMIEAFPNWTADGLQYQDISYSANVEAEGQPEEMEDVLNEIGARNDVLISSKAHIKTFIYQMNGGLLFLGLIVGLILLVGTFLMIYFKQMSEGYEDQDNFAIMKQVGLDDGLIKKTIQSQIKWVFILPILVAAIHSLVSSKIVFNVLGLIGVRDYKLFISNYLLVILAFAMAYGIMYLVTSRLYYKIVNGQEA